MSMNSETSTHEAAFDDFDDDEDDNFGDFSTPSSSMQEENSLSSLVTGTVLSGSLRFIHN